MKISSSICLSFLFSFLSFGFLRADVVIDKQLPAGNIRFERIQGDTVYVQNEIRDTEGWWFYWAFRARGAAGRKLTFVFTNGDPVCTHGPCISCDKGKTWNYAADSFTTKSFVYTFPAGAEEVWFSMGIPYTQRDWKNFLTRHAQDTAFIESGTLCVSRRGRAVEKARIGCIGKTPQYRVFLSARHHAQEMIASYVLEGILDAVLAQNEQGEWFRKNVELQVIPFVDKDGVEDGDQGKNRKPHDHCRDYNEGRPQIYPEVDSIMKLIPSWGGDKLCMIMDIHCPWVRGNFNEFVYQVGIAPPRLAAAQVRFGKLLASVQRGGMDYRQTDDLPYGKSWNSNANYTRGSTLVQWASRRFPDIPLTTSFEIPFATANRATVTRETCRELGEDMAKAIRLFLEKK